MIIETDGFGFPFRMWKRTPQRAMHTAMSRTQYSVTVTGHVVKYMIMLCTITKRAYIHIGKAEISSRLMLRNAKTEWIIFL